MAHRLFHMSANATDFGIERSDPRLKLGNRQGVEILHRQRRQRVVLSTREIIIGVHDAKR